MSKIVPHLWFDKEAVEAAGLYASVFPDSRVTNVDLLHDTPSGDVDIVSYELFGQPFQAISAGPIFKFTPAISFLVRCDGAEQVDALWGELIEGGSALMPLDAYPFSERYGWLQDRYGLSWQFMHDATGTRGQRIIPTLMYVGEVCGRAEEAVNTYTSVFRDAAIDHIDRYGEDDAPDEPGTVRHSGFRLEGHQFAAMDSARVHDTGFNEAISFMVHCESQSEIDYYWDKLSAVPEAEQCGWLKDRFGVSWQIVPTILDDMLRTGDEEQRARVTQAFLEMKKFDVEELRRAYEGAEASV